MDLIHALGLELEPRLITEHGTKTTKVRELTLERLQEAIDAIEEAMHLLGPKE